MTQQAETNLTLKEVIHQINLENPIVERIRVFVNDEQERGIMIEANREIGIHEVFVTYVRADKQIDHRSLHDLAQVLSAEMLTETIRAIHKILTGEDGEGLLLPYHTSDDFHFMYYVAPLADDDRPKLDIRKRS